MPTVLDLQEVLHCPGRMSRDVVILKEPTAFLLNYSLTPGIHSITCPACFYKSLFFPPPYGTNSLWITPQCMEKKVIILLYIYADEILGSLW